MNRPIRWGIWGTGAIAGNVASDFSLARGAVLEAAASRSADRAQTFAARHRAAKWYSSLAMLLSDTAVDAVYIATPNPSHAGDCLACIDAGKAVLCEKPFCLNLAEAQRVVDAARSREIFCMEGMWTRFLPAVIEAKRYVDAGNIGEVRLMQGNFAYPTRPANNPRLYDLNMGGGALFDIGVYPVSLAQHLLGGPERIQGTATIGASGVDEQMVCQLTFAGGAMADLSCSMKALGSNEFVIMGEAGMLRLCDPFYAAHRLVMKRHTASAAGKANVSAQVTGMRGATAGIRNSPGYHFLLRRFEPVAALLRGVRTQSLPFAGNGYQFELIEASNCIRDGRTESAIMPLDDTLEVMRIMDALRASWSLVYPQELLARAGDGA